MTGDQFGGVLRAVLAFLGGFLTQKGVVDEATMTAVVGGVVMIGVAVWSWYTNRKAAAQPPAAPLVPPV